MRSSGRARLKAADAKLLEQVVRRRRPALLAVVESLGHEPLSRGQREDLRSVLAEELCERGLREDSEPNAVGRRIDELIGRLAGF